MSPVALQAVDRLRELLPTEFPPSVAVYLLSRFAVPVEFCFKTGDCGAYTRSTLDLQLRPFLEEQGEWAGRGLAIIVDTKYLYADSFGDLLRVVLHEAAHWFQAPDSVLNRPIEDWPEKALFMADAPGTRPAVGNDGTAGSSGADLPPWADHGADFIRAGLHIHHRANSRGFDASPDLLSIAGPQYGLSPADDYAERLGDEPERLADLHLSEAMKTDPPRAFQELFARDCEAWGNSRASSAPRAAVAAPGGSEGRS